jgi:hypothetical protein
VSQWYNLIVWYIYLNDNALTCNSVVDIQSKKNTNKTRRMSPRSLRALNIVAGAEVGVETGVGAGVEVGAEAGAGKKVEDKSYMLFLVLYCLSLLQHV